MGGSEKAAGQLLENIAPPGSSRVATLLSSSQSRYRAADECPISRPTNGHLLLLLLRIASMAEEYQSAAETNA